MKRITLIFLLSLLVISSIASAQEERFVIGPRLNVVTAGGEPANDIISAGIFAKYRFSSRWLLGFAVDEAEYDFELPWRVVGIEQDSAIEPIDAVVSSTTVSVWAEREFGRDASPWRYFITGGLGVASPSVDSVQGPVAGGGTFDLETDASSELIASGSLGMKRGIGRHFGFEFALRADHHFSEWDVVDRVSGRTGKTGDYTGLGAHVGLNLRF